MAVFLVNICKHGDCGKTFSTLTDLIHHIENVHIDFDPRVIEQHELERPESLPLSYILKYSDGTNNNNIKEIHKEKHSYKYKPIYNGNIPAFNVNQVDNNEPIVIDSEGSEESYHIVEEISSECVMRYTKKKCDVPQFYNKRDYNVQNKQKKFICPVPGCHKRYKNINGIKYHSKNGHDFKGNSIDQKSKKDFKCHCGKSYKTAQGLKSHALLHKDAAIDYEGSKGLMLPPLYQPPNYRNMHNLMTVPKHDFTLPNDDFLAEEPMTYKYDPMNYPYRDYSKLCGSFEDCPMNNSPSLLTPNTSPNFHYTNTIFGDNLMLADTMNSNVPYTLTYRNL